MATGTRSRTTNYNLHGGLANALPQFFTETPTDPHGSIGFEVCFAVTGIESDDLSDAIQHGGGSMKFFNLSLRRRLLLAIIPGFVPLLALVVHVLADGGFLEDEDWVTQLLWIAYAALFGVFVMAPFITSPSRLILRIGVLIVASILIPYAAILSYNWLDTGYGAALGIVDFLDAFSYEIGYAFFVTLSALLLATVLIIAAPLKVSGKYWIYVALAALATTAVYFGSDNWFLCMPIWPGSGCPRWSGYWWSVFAFVIPPFVVAPLSFCTAVYFGRIDRTSDQLTIGRSYRIISALTRPAKSFLVVMVLSVIVSILLWHRWSSNVYGRAVSLYDDGRYADTIELLESVVRTPDDIWFIVDKDHYAERKPVLELLGHMYEYGEGTNVDIDRAFHLYVGALNDGFYQLFPKDPDTGLNRYVGYSDSPRAALAACRLIETFKQALRYCKPFEHPVNAEALGDPGDLKFALDRFRSFLEVSDPNIRLVRASVSGQIDDAIAAIDDGADVDFEYPDYNIRDGHNRLGLMFQHSGGSHTTPLWAAIIRLDLETTELLLQRGADPNLRPAGVDQSLFSRAWLSARLSLWMNGEVIFEEVVSRIRSILRLLHEHDYDITDEDIPAINQRSGHKDISSFQQHDDLLDRLAGSILSAIEEMQDLNGG